MIHPVKNESELFDQWLSLDKNSIAWTVEKRIEFDVFWNFLIHENGFKFSLMLENLKKIESFTNDGPMKSWFSWLREVLIFYHFLKLKYSVDEIAVISSQKRSDVCYILRNFFINTSPLSRDIWNSFFSYDIIDNNFGLRNIDLLVKNYKVDENILNYIIDDNRKGFELTLTEGWEKVKDIFKIPENQAKNKVEKSRSKLDFIKNNFFESLIYIFGLLFLIVIFKWAGKAYQDYNFGKITLNIDEKIQLQPIGALELNALSPNTFPDQSLKTSDNRIDSLEDQLGTELDSQSNEQTEDGDVPLIAASSTLKNFNSAELIKSDYEEEDQDVIREKSSGGYRAYRLIMSSPDIGNAKLKIDQLVLSHKAIQVDKLKPGTNLPGGIYYNLYLPTEQLKSFLEKIVIVEESNLYVNRILAAPPEGKSRVFIWVKSI